MPQLTFQLASPADDHAIRQLLRESPMGDDIAISLEREPSYFSAAQTDGHFHQAIVASEQDSGSLAGFASRSIRTCYVNGEVQAIGYLGQLRVTPNHRRFFPLRQGFEFLRTLHEDGRTPFYLTSILEKNLKAARVLLADIPGMPTYEFYCNYTTFTLSSRVRSSNCTPGHIHIEQGANKRIDELSAFIDDHNRQLQFAPVWSHEDLLNQDRIPNLSHDDFILALDGDKIVGCLGLWDQRPFKQTVIQSYSPAIVRSRFWINLLARLSKKPQLPPAPAVVPHCYLSHICVKNQDATILKALFSNAAKLAQKRGVPLLTIGFSDTHPLHDVVKAYPSVQTASRIFLVYWPEDKSGSPCSLNKSHAGIEVALL